jgi:streptomycin 6-kinase
VYGKEGKDWLLILPNLLNKASLKWKSNDITLYANLKYNYVCSAYSQNYSCKVVLKIGCFPNQVEGEANSLKFYDGLACVKLLDFDRNLNSLLMEAIEPGYSLKKLFPSEEDMAIEHTVQIIRNLHKKPLNNISTFPTIEKILEELINADYIIIPRKYIDKAKLLTSRLLSTQLNSVLLHGDLHHENILHKKDSWVAIDPKGFVGENAFEVGAYIRNPIPELLEHHDHRAIINNRLSKFSNLLGINKERLKEWSFVQAILATCWAGEDLNIAHYMIKIADILDHLE